MYLLTKSSKYPFPAGNHHDGGVHHGAKDGSISSQGTHRSTKAYISIGLKVKN